MIAALLLAAASHLPLLRSDAIIGVRASNLAFGGGFSERWDDDFPIGALVRVPIALEVLHRIEDGTLRPDQEPLVERMVRLGDAAATEGLLRLVGARAVNRRMAALGAAGVRVDRGTATPAAMGDLFVAIARHQDGLSEESHHKLVRWMETSTGVSRIRAALPPDARLAHVEGTVPGGTSDAVIFDSLHVIVIFTKDARSPGQDVERDIAAVTRAVEDWFNPPTGLRSLAFPLPPQSSDAIIGVGSRIPGSGAGWSEREDERFPMGRLVSVPIALEVLHRIDEGTLGAKEAGLAERMVRLGDTSAMNRLLRVVGARAVNRRMALLGADIRVDRGSATPVGMERLLVAIVRHDDALSDDSHDQLMRWMETSTGASRLETVFPPGVKLAHLEGRAPSATSDAVIVDSQRVIVVFTKNAESPPAAVQSDIDAIAGVVWSMMNFVSAPSSDSQR